MIFILECSPNIFFRWLCYCNVPSYCDSLPQYEASAIFGRSFLRLIYSTVQRQLMSRFQAEKDRLPPERRDMILNYFPKFLADMEMELGNDASPAWDPSYVHRLPNHSEGIKGKFFHSFTMCKFQFVLKKKQRKMLLNRTRPPSKD